MKDRAGQRKQPLNNFPNPIYYGRQHIVFNDRQAGVIYLFCTEASPKYFSPAFPDHLTFQQLGGSEFTHEENTTL
jgi:hypothetical protein